MKTPDPNSMQTVGEIARRTGSHIHQVEYVVRAREIRPASRAGNARVFSETDVERIASELRRIASLKREGSRG